MLYCGTYGVDGLNTSVLHPQHSHTQNGRTKHTTVTYMFSSMLRDQWSLLIFIVPMMLLLMAG